MLHLEADHGAGHDGWLVEGGPESAAAKSWVQAVPGGDLHGAVGVVLGGRLVLGCGPGAWVGELDPVPVATGSSSVPGAGGVGSV